MENYERKYKEALGWMQGLYSGLHGATKEEAEHYFPELKESESEGIRKDIISYLRNEKIVKRYISDIEVDKWLAWLEKQCEQQGKSALEADKVIAWLVANICHFEYYVELFKKDFGL